MKKLKIFAVILLAFQAIFFVSCDDALENGQNEESILPERFGVDIPDALSNNSAHTNGRTAEVDSLDGNVIYANLALFIHVGEEASHIVREIITAIAIYQINRPMQLSYESDEDGRVKNLEVVAGPEFDGATWEFGLTITDAASESHDDGGKAIQVFWNRDPIMGIAILKPYNINRNDPNAGEAIVRVDYDESGDTGYDNYMEVAIADFPVADPLENPYALEALKMIVGKSGDVYDVYGNSNHPNAKFFTADTGFNWAFVASGGGRNELGVAEVGLPPSDLDESDRNVLLKDYAIKEVFANEIYEVWPNIDPASVETFLGNTGAPGYFNDDGFVQGGTSPGSAYDEFESRIDDLMPFNPIGVSNLSIEFK